MPYYGSYDPALLAALGTKKPPTDVSPDVPRADIKAAAMEAPTATLPPFRPRTALPPEIEAQPPDISQLRQLPESEDIIADRLQQMQESVNPYAREAAFREMAGPGVQMPGTKTPEQQALDELYARGAQRAPRGLMARLKSGGLGLLLGGPVGAVAGMIN